MQSILPDIFNKEQHREPPGVDYEKYNPGVLCAFLFFSVLKKKKMSSSVVGLLPLKGRRIIDRDLALCSQTFDAEFDDVACL